MKMSHKTGGGKSRQTTIIGQSLDQYQLEFMKNNVNQIHLDHPFKHRQYQEQAPPTAHRMKRTLDDGPTSNFNHLTDKIMWKIQNIDTFKNDAPGKLTHGYPSFQNLNQDVNLADYIDHIDKKAPLDQSHQMAVNAND